MEPVHITSVDYMDIVRLAPSFISLDISVNSTGWVRWVNGVFTRGTYSLLTAKDDATGRRREFRNFLKELFGDDEYAFLFVEDVIGGRNFETNKILYQLNPLADDLIDEGVLKVAKVVREDNKKWKSHLKKASGYVSSIRAASDDKQTIRECLYLLGFGDKTTKDIKEDEYDALGLAVGCLFRLFVVKDTKPQIKLRKDVARGYQVKQFSDVYEALDFANDLGGDIYQLNYLNINRDLRYNFKRSVTELERDTYVFVISIHTARIGALALEKDLRLDTQFSHLVVYHKSLEKRGKHATERNMAHLR